MNKPEITIGITSYNRFYYLSAILDSLAICLPKHIPCKVVVADNSSSEPDLVKLINNPSAYREKLEPHLLEFVTCRPKHWLEAEYVARNAVLDNAQGKYLMFLQDDVQCIVKGLFLEDQMNIIDNLNCMQILLDGVRKCTIKRKMNNSLRHTGINVDSWETHHKHFATIGFSSLDLHKKVGSYMIDAGRGWGQGENDYSERVIKAFPNKLVFFLQVPTFIGIWNDPRGNYSVVRDGVRHGHYIKALDERNLYYDILKQDELLKLNKEDFPRSFTDLAKPLGWDYAKEADGEQRKYPWSEIEKEGPSKPI
tara:strand:- start:145 stop:1071 length:927 start_codon:yes stop_codon:yes gene_type:complete